MHTPFKSIEKDPNLRSLLKKKDREKRAETVSSPKPSNDGPDVVSETDFFLHAMSDVAPLTKGGRDIAGCASTPAAASQPQPTFAQLLESTVEFEMEYSHEFMTGQIRGLDFKLFRKLKAGEFSVEAHHDLHGLNSEQARTSVTDFVRRCYMEGKRCVLLIPGRGLNSPSGQGVLRQELSGWLTQAPLKRIVLAFTTALPKHGGSGAVYLLLRQVRKDRGKIAWENIFTDLEG